MKVVIAFIRNNKNQILITQRALNTSFGGYWELPGGKVHIDEKYSDALRREIKEELGLDIVDCILFKILQLEHEFILFEVRDVNQEINLKAGQLAYQWNLIEEMDISLFPPSNILFFQAWQEYRLNAN